MNRLAALFILACVAATPAPAIAQAAKTVQAGGVNAVLIQPARPVASIILLAGGNGQIGVTDDGNVRRGGNQLVRTRAAYAARGFAVLVPDAGYNLAALVTYMQAIKRPVTVVGTSRGTIEAARGIASGAKPDKLVLTSGFLSAESGGDGNVDTILGSPSALPPTLVIHHRQDRCKFTLPEGVEPFIKWAKGKARVIWLSGGKEEGDWCEARAHHGFNGQDGQVVSAVAGFAR